MRNNFFSSLESIDYQGTKFFDALVEAITAHQKSPDAKLRRPKDYRECSTLLDVRKVVMKYTGIPLNPFENGDYAIFCPGMKQNHIFHNDIQRLAFDKGLVGGGAYSLESVLSRKNKGELLTGTVSMKHSHVTGVFSEIPIQMLAPYDDLRGASGFPVEMIAAYILHEVGHAFCHYEYLTRVTSTNLCLQAFQNYLDHGSDTERGVVFFKAAEVAGMDKSRAEALSKAKSMEQVSVIVYDHEIEQSRSQLGVSIYDRTGIEFLADQFAIRHGAGMWLAKARERSNRAWGGPDNGLFWTQISMMAISAVVGGPLGVGIGMAQAILFTMLVAGVSFDHHDHDDEPARIDRIKQDLIQILKQVDASETTTRDHILEQIKAIEAIEPTISKKTFMYFRLAKLVRPGLRKSEKYEEFQQKLEELSANSLFVQEQKLKQLAGK